MEFETVNAVAGSQFDVSLLENPTTGYTWKIKGDYPPHVKLLSDQYVPDGGSVGGGGVHTWHFQAIQKGQPAITFESARPTGPVTKTFVVNIV